MLTSVFIHGTISTKRDERRIKMQYADMNASSIGAKIRELRTQRGETTEELAKSINASVSAVGMYENGYRIPRDEIKIRIAEHYLVPVESIFFQEKQHETC